MRRETRALGLLCAAAAVLCGCPGGPVPAKEFGEQLFNDARFADSQFNAFSCATCHSVRPEGDPDRILSGHTLYDVTARPSFWGGQETRLIDAASFCFVYFMRGRGPLDPDDPKSKALYEYLHSISPDEEAGAPALPFTVVTDIVDVPKGDAARGATVYAQACRSCHGELHSANGRLTDRASRLPEITETYPTTFPGVNPRLVIIEKIRHGQFFG
ncbi:MAG: c-type cytochrome, partial [Myxococcaceae bacterium]|nr:c-type cytochrome [Myxococcaceae bacterium]